MSIDLYITNVRKITSSRSNIENDICDYYFRKYKTAPNELEASQELAAGLLLKRILNIDAGDLIALSEFGKPYLSSEKSTRRFNISHSGEYAILAVCDNGEVGVDIEKITMPLDSVVNKVFSKEDATLIQNAFPDERSMVFTKCWTRFEAALKLKGTGLSHFEETNKLEVCGGIFLHTEVLSDYVISCAAYEQFDLNMTKVIL